MIAYFECDSLYAAAYRHRLDSADEGLVVLHNKTVLDADPVARSRKVAVGRSKSDARALLPNGRYVDFRAEEVEPAMEAWLDVLARYTSIIEPLEPHRAFADFSAHTRCFDLIDEAIQLIETSALRHVCHSEVPVTVRVGVAPSRWVAEVSCGAPLGIAAADPAGFVHDLPIDRMLPVLQETRARLAFLGYRRVGDLAQVPFPSLRRQFGEEAHLIRSCVQGLGDGDVLPLHPKGAIQRHFRFESPVEEEAPLEAAIQHLSVELAKELSRLEQCARRLRWSLETEDGVILPRERTFQRPFYASKWIEKAIGLVAKPYPTTSIVAVSVRLLDLGPVELGQRSLQGEVSTTQRKTNLSHALHAVREVFGDRAVIPAAQKPELRRRKVLRVWKESTGWQS